MTPTFFKFPTTPHLAILGDTEVRGDKVMSASERNDFLRHEIIVEEKVDGANLGISFDAYGELFAQNRGSYLSPSEGGQWKKLDQWLLQRTDQLFEQLTDRYILFGEWCYALHSIFYDQLPDWFLGFDLYDKTHERFIARHRRDEMLSSMCIERVPAIATGTFSLEELTKLLTQSQLGYQPAEGLYLRFDQGLWLGQRAKLVKPCFTQSIDQHWSRSPLRVNRLRSEVSLDTD